MFSILELFVSNFGIVKPLLNLFIWISFWFYRRRDLSHGAGQLVTAMNSTTYHPRGWVPPDRFSLARPDNL